MTLCANGCIDRCANPAQCMTRRELPNGDFEVVVVVVPATGDFEVRPAVIDRVAEFERVESYEWSTDWRCPNCYNVFNASCDSDPNQVHRCRTP